MTVTNYFIVVLQITAANKVNYFPLSSSVPDSKQILGNDKAFAIMEEGRLLSTQSVPFLKFCT